MPAVDAMVQRPPAAPLRISAIEPDPARPWALRLSANGRLYCTVSREVVEAERLVIGAELDSPAQARLGRAADVEAAYHAAVRALGQRARSRADLARRLSRKGHPKDAVEAALQRVEAGGMLNDQAFAEHYTQSRAARGRGPGRIRRDLLALGVQDADIDNAIGAQWPADTDPLVQARALAEKRAPQLAGLARPVGERRLLAYLARRGFRGRGILDLVREVLHRA